MMIDVPNVKGNAKGLMRAVNDNKPEDPANVLWFFTTTIGKRSYANIVLDTKGELHSPPFHKEGAFAEWQKEKNKRYFIFRYTINGEKLVVGGGNGKVVEHLMAAENFKRNASGIFETSAGWFARDLDKNDPDKIYDAGNSQTYTREKKWAPSFRGFQPWILAGLEYVRLCNKGARRGRSCAKLSPTESQFGQALT
jgi:hypothetical protein